MRDTYQTAAGARRLILAVGKRVAMEDPEQLRLIQDLHVYTARAMATAIAGLREGGHTDKAIGEALGMTRQAVQQAWPRTERVVGAGARYRAR